MSDKQTELAGVQKQPVEPNRLLPTIEMLYANDALEKIINAAKFQMIVNQPPKPEWLRDHPIAKTEIEVIENNVKVKKKVPVKYLPIERVEWLLVNVVMRYRIEIREIKQIANSVTITVRLHYWDPVFSEWTFSDGVGSAPLQTDAGASATDWAKIKPNSVQIGAPAAKSYAIKDAAEQLGKLFGKDLNRKENLSLDYLPDKYANALKTDETKND